MEMNENGIVTYILCYLLSTRESYSLMSNMSRKLYNFTYTIE